MIRTIEAVIDADGNIRLLGEVRVDAPRRAFLTVLDEPATLPSEPALLSEAALAADWSRPEEDAAWSHLQRKLGWAEPSRPTSPACRLWPNAVGIGTSLGWPEASKSTSLVARLLFSGGPRRLGPPPYDLQP